MLHMCRMAVFEFYRSIIIISMPCHPSSTSTSRPEYHTNPPTPTNTTKSQRRRTFISFGYFILVCGISLSKAWNQAARQTDKHHPQQRRSIRRRRNVWMDIIVCICRNCWGVRVRWRWRWRRRRRRSEAWENGKWVESRRSPYRRPYDNFIMNPSPLDLPRPNHSTIRPTNDTPAHFGTNKNTNKSSSNESGGKVGERRRMMKN